MIASPSTAPWRVPLGSLCCANVVGPVTDCCTAPAAENKGKAGIRPNLPTISNATLSSGQHPVRGTNRLIVRHIFMWKLPFEAKLWGYRPCANGGIGSLPATPIHLLNPPNHEHIEARARQREPGSYRESPEELAGRATTKPVKAGAATPARLPTPFCTASICPRPAVPPASGSAPSDWNSTSRRRCTPGTAGPWTDPCRPRSPPAE